MDSWTLIISLYFSSVIAALVLTYKEQKRRGQSTPIYTAIGYFLCMVWPLVAAVMLIFYKPTSD